MAKHTRSGHAKDKTSLFRAAALTSGVLVAAGGGAVAGPSTAAAETSAPSSTQTVSDSLFGFGAFVPSILGLTPQGGTPTRPICTKTPTAG